MRHAAPALPVLALLALLAVPAAAGDLEEDLGRAETRVRSAAYPLVAGRTVQQMGLPERLERLGYERVREKPTRPGTWFWGNEVVWIYRRAHRVRGRDHAAGLIGLAIDAKSKRVTGAYNGGREPYPLDSAGILWLEPETLAESLTEARAERVPIVLADLPERVWRPVLAAEDHRFFDHVGVSGMALARAAIANVKKGGVAQGGSTITQQLIKNRDLTPKRSLTRKASEAVRALALEAEYSKEEILEAYLDTTYWGHADGLALHGLGTAARAWFSKAPADLTLAEAAALAAMIQGPNRLSPDDHAEALRERRDWVLSRMQELGWADADQVARAKAAPVRAKVSAPTSRAPRSFLSWIDASLSETAEARLEEGRGVVVETGLDPLLQAWAEDAVRDGLASLRKGHRRLRDAGLSAALVAIDPTTGDVLAYVGGDPDARGDAFDRARQAKRQPGSTVKPFVVLEAYAECGEKDALYPASRVADEPLTLDLPSGRWQPENFDRKHLGVIHVRDALAGSRNVPLVRIARHCGFDAVAARFRDVGLDLPENPPPSFVLGAVETTPLALARAYTALATPGRTVDPRPFTRVERPAGRAIESASIGRTRAANPAAAWLVRDTLRTAVDEGTARLAAGVADDVAAKTGSSSELRDAWFAGHADGVVAVVWVGLDDGASLGLTGAAAAGPIWRAFMERAVAARPPRPMPEPRGVLRGFVQPSTGLRVNESRRDAEAEVFRRGAAPPKRRIWRRDEPIPVVR